MPVHAVHVPPEHMRPEHEAKPLHVHPVAIVTPIAPQTAALVVDPCEHAVAAPRQNSGKHQKFGNRLAHMASDRQASVTIPLWKHRRHIELRIRGMSTLCLHGFHVPKRKRRQHRGHCENCIKIVDARALQLVLHWQPVPR